MAPDSSGSEEEVDRAHRPRECMACRGSGQVVSNLGGTPKSVVCPWCGGAGLRREGIDAQASSVERESAAGDAETSKGDAETSKGDA